MATEEKILFELVLDTDKLNAVAKEAAKNVQVLKDEQKKLKEEGKQNTVEYQKLSNEITRNKKVLKDTTKTIQDATRANKNQSGSINSLRQQLKVATAARNSMSKAEREGTTRGRELTQTVKTLNEELKRQESQVGDNRRNVGNYSDVLKTGALRVKDFALQMVGWVAIIGIVSRAISSAIKITRDYEKELSTLQSITGSTREEMEFFSEASVKIGEDTKTSATEVVKAFTLIGSAQPELLKSREELAEVTKQSLILAKAAGIETTEAATALTSAMNQFGVSASEAAKFTDIFATSQQKGSSFIQATSLALENSGAAASAAGLSFETTNAAIQALAKGAITGARAGTALRGVLGKLSKQNDDEINPSLVGLGSTIEELAKRNLSLKDAIELVGEEGATGLLTLIKQRDIFDELDGSLNEVGNAQEQMAINLDNLDGAIEETNQAWELFILSLNEGDGTLAKVIRGIVDLGTEALELFTILARGRKGLEEWGDELAKGAIESSKLNKGIRGNTDELRSNLTSLILAKRNQNELLKEEKSRVLTIGELKKELSDLKNAQDNLIPGSQALIENQNQIIRIERLLGKENKTRIAELKKLKKEEEDIEKKALKLKQLFASAEVDNTEGKEQRLTAIENLRFERLEEQLLKEFGATAETKLLIEELEKTHQANLIKISEDAAAKLLANDQKEFERQKREKEKAEIERQKTEDEDAVRQRLIAETSLNIAQQTSDALFENANRNREREFLASLKSVNDKSDKAQLVLDQQLDQSLISQEDFDEATRVLNEEREANELQLRKTTFESQKKADKLQAEINGALAVVKAIAQFGPPPSPAGIAGIITAVATTATQVAFINGRKFARGTGSARDGISSQHTVDGPSHSQSGVNYIGDDGHGFNVEGGEIITVVNKKSANTIRGLSRINSMNGNGVSFGGGGIAGNYQTYQDGGFADRQASSPSNESERLAKLLAEEISKLTIVTLVDDITDATGQKDKIANRVRV